MFLQCCCWWCKSSGL